MSRAERAIKDAGKLFGSQLAVGAFAVVWSAWLVRMLPTHELAVWPICLALGDLVLYAGTFGTRDLFARMVPAEIAQGRPERARGILKAGLLATIGFSVLLVGVLFVAAAPVGRLLFKDPVGAELVRWMTAAVLLRVVRKRLESALVALQEFGRVAFVDMVCEMARSPLSVVLYIAMGVKGVILALTLVPLFASVLFAISLRPHLAGPARLGSGRELVRVALPFYGVSILGFFAQRIDYLLLTVLISPTALAPYFVARKLAQYVGDLSTSVFSSIAPKLAEHRGRPAEDVERAFTKCTRYLFLLLAPVYVALAVAAPQMVQLYAGDKYPSAVLLLRVLSMFLLLESLYGIHREHIRVFADPRHMLGQQAAGAVFSTTVLLLLVRPLAALGVALGRAITHALWLLLARWVLRLTLRTRYDGGALLTALLASSCMAATMLLCQTVWPSPFVLPLAIPAGIAAYGLALRRRLTAADVELVLGCLPKRLVRGPAGAKLSGALLRFWAGGGPEPNAPPGEPGKARGEEGVAGHPGE